jgi:CRP/FNR family transcriptional regulator
MGGTFERFVVSASRCRTQRKFDRDQTLSRFFEAKHDKLKGKMTMPETNPEGPAIRAPDPWASRRNARGTMDQLLSDEERSRLAAIATIVRFKKGAEIYRGSDRADAAFNITSGVVKAYTCGPDGKEHIAAFLFPEDVFGLAQERHYANSVKALTPVTAYRIPVTAPRSRLTADAALDFHIIAKLCHELRQAQRHAFLLASKRTLSKLTMFLQMLEQLQSARGNRRAKYTFRWIAPISPNISVPHLRP